MSDIYNVLYNKMKRRNWYRIKDIRMPYHSREVAYNDEIRATIYDKTKKETS